MLSLYEDSRDNLWAGAHTGLWRWKPGPPKLYPIPSPEIRAMIEGDNGAFLISVLDGIRQVVDWKGRGVSASRSRAAVQSQPAASGSRWWTLDRNE